MHLWLSQNLDVLQWTYTEAPGLVEIDSSVILGPFGSNQLLPCPMGFPDGTVTKNPPANAGDKSLKSDSWSGRSPGGGNGNPLQYSCLENSMYRGAWWATVHGVSKSQTWLSEWAHTHMAMSFFQRLCLASFPPVSFLQHELAHEELGNREMSV